MMNINVTGPWTNMASEEFADETPQVIWRLMQRTSFGYRQTSFFDSEKKAREAAEVVKQGNGELLGLWRYVVRGLEILSSEKQETP